MNDIQKPVTTMDSLLAVGFFLALSIFKILVD